ncbi:MAG: rubredoxin [Methanobrevibacter sp. CfCl-M3]
MKFKCICFYVYDPDKGEAEKNVAAGTAWEDVPDNFRCPSCGAGKKSFLEVK